MARVVINGNGTVSLGDSGHAKQTLKSLQFEAAGWGVGGTIQVVGRRRQGTNTLGGTASAALTNRALPYRKLFLNGAVADNTIVSAGITDNSIIEVPSTGLEVSLVTTGYVGGTMTVDSEDVGV